MGLINTNRWNRLRYTVYAPFYDGVVRLLGRGRRRSIERLGLSGGERVLVVGCGTGLDFEHLPTDIHLTAGDITPAMVSRARRRAARLGIDADVRVLDAHGLDVADASMDAVILHLILAVVPDPEAAIREAARVLKPGGRVVIFDKFLPADSKPSIGRRALDRVLRVLATEVNRSVEPLLEHAGLVAEYDEAVYGNFFRVIVARRR